MLRYNENRKIGFSHTYSQYDRATEIFLNSCAVCMFG
jgi:hypothetical protein